MTIGQKIKTLRISAGITQQALADRIGISKATISRYEKGNIENIPSDKIENIAKILNVAPAEIMGWQISSALLPSNAIPLTEIPRIPVVGKIAAGQPILAVENIIGYEYVPDLQNPEECFCLVVQGDSMINAGIVNGSKVVIHTQQYAEDGQIVACMVNGDEATLKRFKRVGDTIILMPENPAYAPILVKCSDFDNGYARIIGVATHTLTVKRL